MRHLTTATAALIAGVLVATLGAQQNPRTLGPVSGPVLTIDFGALDAKGQPVTNLNTADIAVRIDGKLREVRQLQLITRDKPLPLGTPASDPMPVPFVSNAAASDTGRTVFVIFDNETMARAGSSGCATASWRSSTCSVHVIRWRSSPYRMGASRQI